MVTINELKNRVNATERRICVAFEYEVGGQKFVFTRHAENIPSEHDKIWYLETHIPRTNKKDTENWYIAYVMPKAELPLPLICATGLRYYQNQLKEEIQHKSEMDFELGNVLEGMV